MKSISKSLIFIIIIYFLLSLAGLADLSIMIPIISIVGFVSTFNYDKYNKWDSYAVSFPNGRKNLVKGKYVANLILILLSTLFFGLLSLVISQISGTFTTYKNFFFLLSQMFAISCIASAVIYPVIFKFGVEKGRLIITGIIFILTFFLTLLLESLSHLPSLVTSILLSLSPVIGPIIYYLSYYLSKKIYSHKEF